MYGNLRVFLGSLKLCDITPQWIEKFKQIRGREVSPATVNRKTACSSICFFQAAK
jgi:hypothetical protein